MSEPQRSPRELKEFEVKRLVDAYEWTNQRVADSKVKERLEKLVERQVLPQLDRRK